MKTLEVLPEELVSNITARLHADDMAAFRLVSRTLEQKSFHEFATEYFTEKCFMFTTESLKVLVAIASSSRLRAYLKHVHFMTAIFSHRAFKCPRGCQCAWQPSVKQSEAFRGYVEDQKTLRSTKRDRQMLAEAFASLPSLSTLSVDDLPSKLPPNVDYRGNNKVPRLCGRPPMYAPHAATDEGYKEYDKFFRHVWDVVVQALQHTVALTHLATHLGKTSDGVPITFLDTKRFPKSRCAFQTLNALLLRIRGDDRTNKTWNDVEHELDVLRRFAKSLKSLQVLDLSFDSSLLTGSYLLAFTSGLKLGTLTTFYLGGVAINAKILNGILRKLISIEDLRLVHIDVTTGNWISILKTLQDRTGHLEHLHLMYLLEAGRKVYFLRQNEQAHFYGDPDASEAGSIDEDGETDDDLPPLEPGDVEILQSIAAGLQDDDNMKAAGTESTKASTVPATLSDAHNSSTTQGSANTTIPTGHSDADHSRPGEFGTGERGYFVCLQGEQIAAQLPIFIQEYNIGEDVNEHMVLPAFAGGAAPPIINTLMNMFGAALGVPGVPLPASVNGGGGTPGAAAPNANNGTNTIPTIVPLFGPAPHPAASTVTSNANADPSVNTQEPATFEALWDHMAEHVWGSGEDSSNLD